MKKTLNLLLEAVLYAALFQVYGYGANVQIRDLATTVILPASNTYLIVDGATQGTAKAFLASMPQITNTRATLAALSVTNVSTGVAVQTLGGVTVADGLGALYYYNSASAATPNGTTIIQPTVGTGRWLIVTQSGLPAPSTTSLGGVFSKAAIAGQYLTSIGTDGTPTSATVTTADVTGLGTMASQNSNAVTITAGNITGLTTLSATTLTVSTTGNIAQLIIKGSQVNESLTNGLASVDINYDGYNGGTTQFRNTTIYDGKNAVVALFTGSTKALAVAGAFTSASAAFTTPLALTSGGTGSATASGARTNLGVSATGADTTYAFRANNLSDLASAATARTNLGVTATGSDTTYAFRSNNLSDLGSASTARTNLGLGTMATQASSAVSITGGSVTGITPLALADGGTGAASASGARSNLGVTATGGDTTYLFRTNNLSDLTNASTARSNLGLGTMATQASTSVSITGGSFTGATSFSASSNTTLRTIKGALNIIINVKDYGALGDGSTNDTSAIASAKAAAVTAHGSLYFPAGTYLTDTISVTSAAGLAIYGDGIGVSVVKARTPSQVLNIATSTRVSVYHLTFDGSCTTRTAGQQAVIFDASQSSFCDNEIINSGEFAAFFGSGSAITDVIISRNLIRACYADGINLANVTRAVVADNIIDGSDDDCIAMGYHGATSFIVVSGNYCRARSDLGTTWGRGIAVLGASDVIVYGNFIENIKQYGIILDQNGSSARPTRIQMTGNTVKDSPTISGSAVSLYRTTDCIFSDNTVINPIAGGECIEVADWQNLTIQGGFLQQARNQFCRGIHANESAGWAASWDTLKISRVSIQMSGASTNSCVYLNPHSSVTMNTIIIDGVVGQQVVAGDYITVGSARTGTLAKIVNNTTATASRTVTPSSSSGVFTVVNNN